jgi:hypothetical protein
MAIHGIQQDQDNAPKGNGHKVHPHHPGPSKKSLKAAAQVLDERDKAASQTSSAPVNPVSLMLEFKYTRMGEARTTWAERRAAAVDEFDEGDDDLVPSNLELLWEDIVGDNKKPIVVEDFVLDVYLDLDFPRLLTPAEHAGNIDPVSWASTYEGKKKGTYTLRRNSNDHGTHGADNRPFETGKCWLSGGDIVFASENGKPIRAATWDRVIAFEGLGLNLSQFWVSGQVEQPPPPPPKEPPPSTDHVLWVGTLTRDAQLFSEPSEGSTPVALINHGAQVEVFQERENNWIYVHTLHHGHQNKAGWLDEYVERGLTNKYGDGFSRNEEIGG